MRRDRGLLAAPLDYFEVDLPYPTLDIDIESDLRVSVSVIDVDISLLLEALGVDLTQTAPGFRPNAHLAGQQHRGPAHSALYAGDEVR